MMIVIEGALPALRDKFLVGREHFVVEYVLADGSARFPGKALPTRYRL